MIDKTHSKVTKEKVNSKLINETGQEAALRSLDGTALGTIIIIIIVIIIIIIIVIIFIS